MNKVMLYPLWLRIWHWFNAALFAVLIATGISMHYSASNDLFITFRVAMYTHNVVGITLSLIYIYYVIFNIISGNYKQYLPKLNGIFDRLIKQGLYYVYGVFKGAEHPFHTSAKQKFNPLQQLTYLSIMFLMLPLIIISGWLLMFPEIAPANVMGMGGVWPMAILHIAVGYFLSLFMFGHIYLATHGEKITTNFKSMIDGYHDVHEEHKEKLVIKTGYISEYSDDSREIDIHTDYKIDTGGDKNYNPETKIIKNKKLY
jgi:thiosulfate reductase cytochrome b subunit